MSAGSEQLAAQQRRVRRHFQHFTSWQRADRAASHRLKPGQRRAVGEYFYTHPDVPGRAFDTRGRAARAALAAHEAAQPFVSSWAGLPTGLDTHGNLDALATSKTGGAVMPQPTAQPGTDEGRYFCTGCIRFLDEGHGPACPYGTGFEGLSAVLARALAHQRTCLPDLDGAGCQHTRPYFPRWTLKRATRDLTQEARDEGGTATVTLAAAGELMLCEPARRGRIRFVSMRMCTITAAPADAFTDQL